MQILLGSDPETFIKDTKTGEFISAHDLIPGTKENPFGVSCGAIQVDGVAAEFNTNPTDDVDEFVKNHASVLKTIENHIKHHSEDYVIEISPTATFKKEYFDALPEGPKELGCMPDYDAYTGEVNDPPSTDEPFRTAGGHVHFGWGEYFDISARKHLELCCSVVRQLDAVLFEGSRWWDKDEKRRELYGRRGAFRPRSYGVEYRPLSNMWLKDEKVMRWVFEAGHRAVDLLLNHDKVLYDDPILKHVKGIRYFMYLTQSYGIPMLDKEFFK